MSVLLQAVVRQNYQSALRLIPSLAKPAVTGSPLIPLAVQKSAFSLLSSCVELLPRTIQPAALVTQVVGAYLELATSLGVSTQARDRLAQIADTAMCAELRRIVSDKLSTVPENTLRAA